MNSLASSPDIEVFYNRQRSHQTLEYKTPLQVKHNNQYRRR
jgi:hypothetical protein